MTEFESIMLAVCFGYMLGDTLSKVILIFPDIIRTIKRRRHTKTDK